MAEVTVKRTLIVPEPPPTKITEVTLTLTHEEATLVAILVGNVGGNISSPLRQAAEVIWEVLETEGLTTDQHYSAARRDITVKIEAH